jgi:imidazolonepropionase
VRLLLENIGQLATCPHTNPQQDAGLIDNAALVIEDGLISWSGPAAALPQDFRALQRFDCGGRLVVPGLIDCHTHLCFGGWRADEFEMRLAGHDYLDIQAAGGGINATVKATRASPFRELMERSGRFLRQMLSLGVTTVEAKSGYGLDLDTEIRQLEVYAELNECQAVDVVATVLGAHVVPPEFADARDAYVDLLCDQLLPLVAERGLATFCDVFVEHGAFSRDEARRILLRAHDLGLGTRVHADQLSDGGGAALAAEMRATSAEHLEYISPEGIAALAASGTVAVSLPLASLYLDEPYLPARELINAGVPVAVATDFNPGSAPSFHLPLAMLLACLKQSMSPQECLMGVTSIAARAVAREDRIGSLRRGYNADLAIIDAPRLNQWLYHFQANACQAVMKDGLWVKRVDGF